ncbi:uncharacterized protein OCT59_027051 [Rhizophagus irregularis]|nr:hypothetical protein OCT59_027051 [Rhizophagus irregularis]
MPNKLVKKVQLKINDYNDTIFEWIPYYQIVDIKDLNNTIYSAKWKDGPLYWNGKAYTRNLENKAVILKYLVNAQNELLDEITAYYNNLQIYGISQKPSTEDYIVVLNQEQYIKIFCNKCTNKYFSDIKEIGKGGFARVYSAKWKDGPLYWNKKKYTRDSNKTVALKCLNNSQNISNKFLNEVEAYSINNLNNTDNSGEILKIFGISQNPDTKDYIMVLQHARGGNFNNWLNNNYKNFNWSYKLKVLNNIINGLKEIHQKQLVHRDLHTGNILFKDTYYWVTSNYISDMGSSGEVDNMDETNIYGVMPYVAPEVLRGSTYTEAADVYSFGMIMYFVATEKQPFANRAHDGLLALDICNGIRPEINEQEAPKCYIDLMTKCLDTNPANRLNVNEVEESIKLFYEDQFKAAEEYRLNNNDGDKDNQSTHPQAIYTSRLLNPFTKSLPKYTDDNTDCLDCAI